MLGLNDDNTATYSVRNTTVYGSAGSTALMMGRVAVNESVVWECQLAGSVYQQVRPVCSDDD